MLYECTAHGAWIEVRGKERWGVELAQNWLADPQKQRPKPPKTAAC